MDLSLVISYSLKKEVSHQILFSFSVVVIFVFLVPNISPKNVGVVRLNVTHMNVTWTKLTLEEARGFITAYTVSYEMVGVRRRKDVMEEISEPENSYIVVGGLGFTTSYSVMVSASTIAGQGISTSAITVQGKHCHIASESDFMSYQSLLAPAYSFFQLRIKGVPNCFEWTVSTAFLI